METLSLSAGGLRQQVAQLGLQPRPLTGIHSTLCLSCYQIASSPPVSPLTHRAGPPSPQLPAPPPSTDSAIRAAHLAWLPALPSARGRPMQSLVCTCVRMSVCGGGVPPPRITDSCELLGEGVQGCGMVSAVNIIHDREADDLVTCIVAPSQRPARGIEITAILPPVLERRSLGMLPFLKSK